MFFDGILDVLQGCLLCISRRICECEDVLGERKIRIL